MAKHLLKFNTAAEYSAATIETPAVSWVVSDNEIKNDFYVPLYVEIGGVKWAKMNIGAETETDYGLIFQWGDISGYTASQVGSGDGKKAFTWADYKYNNGSTDPSAADMTKYNKTDNLTTLEASDDAATANLGSDWRMPTSAEFQALGNAVNTAWTTDYQGSGVAGLVCTDKTDSSKVLFFPAAGYCYNGSVYNVRTDGAYWSSSRTGWPTSAYFLTFRSNDINWSYDSNRYRGYKIRPVHI